MSRFKDIYAPLDMVSAPCISSPRWSTQLVMTNGGDEQANSQWSHPLWRFQFPEVIREQSTFADVRNHWLIMRGPFHTFPFRDPMDFASVELDAPNEEPTVDDLDQVIGTGDGSEQDFQLVKTYAIGDEEYARDIILPVADSVVVAVDGVPVGESAFYVTRPGGVLHLDVPPGVGQIVTAGFLFDVLVRFAADDIFGGIIQKNGIAGYQDLELLEVRYCAD